MKASTVAALERINREFYRLRAREFSDTRKQPWPGWQRVSDLARKHLGPGRISVLDLGCGNGRFGTELDRLLGSAGLEISCLGIDSSVPLLGLAAAKSGSIGVGEQSFVAGDLVHRPLAQLAGRARFDLIVNFGLMHHIPSQRARAQLLAASAEHLRIGGLMAVSFWQFGGLERFENRTISWLGCQDVDPEDLEAGDRLLAWGESGAARYCHFTSPAEAEALVGPLGLEEISSFRSDGKTDDLNLYWVGHNT